jgi:hypothetical protein
MKMKKKVSFRKNISEKQCSIKKNISKKGYV